MMTNELMVFPWSLYPCIRVDPQIGVTLLNSAAIPVHFLSILLFEAIYC